MKMFGTETLAFFRRSYILSFAILISDWNAVLGAWNPIRPRASNLVARRRETYLEGRDRGFRPSVGVAAPRAMRPWVLGALLGVAGVCLPPHAKSDFLGLLAPREVKTFQKFGMCEQRDLVEL